MFTAYSYFLHLDVLHLKTFSTQGCAVPSRTSWFLKIVKNLPGSILPICKPTIPLSSLTWQTNIFPAYNHPRARYQTSRDNPCGPKASRITHLFNFSELFILPALPFPQKPHKERFCPMPFLSPFCPLTNTNIPTRPCGSCGTFSTGECEWTNHLCTALVSSCHHPVTSINEHPQVGMRHMAALSVFIMVPILSDVNEGSKD